MQIIYAGGMNENETAANAAAALENSEKTTLTQWFSNNLYEWGLQHQETDRTPQPRGNQLKHSQYPKYYRWDKETKEWIRRKNFSSKSTGGHIGRMRFVAPTASAMATYYLRILLTVVVGARNFEDLKKVDGVMHDTYKQACFARGLIEDDDEWDVSERSDVECDTSTDKTAVCYYLECRKST